jgi:hypothetical protein
MQVRAAAVRGREVVMTKVLVEEGTEVRSRSACVAVAQRFEKGDEVVDLGVRERRRLAGRRCSARWWTRRGFGGASSNFSSRRRERNFWFRSLM